MQWSSSVLGYGSATESTGEQQAYNAPASALGGAGQPLRTTSIWHERDKRPASPISATVSPSHLRPDKIRSYSLSSTSTTHACACDANAAIFGQQTERGHGRDESRARRQAGAATAAQHQQQVSQQLRRTEIRLRALFRLYRPRAEDDLFCQSHHPSRVQSLVV
ncbi:hypothetical protein CF326_g9128 [Tilletia indica]|nr:hypothetical protein CF326_g9128 [Tilletia indica]